MIIRKISERLCVVSCSTFTMSSLVCLNFGKVLDYVWCRVNAVLQSPWSEPAFFCIQPMVVKQALAVTDHGNGRINAAYGMLEATLGAIGAALWGGKNTQARREGLFPGHVLI